MLLIIEHSKQTRKQPQEMFCKVGAPRNLRILLHVESSSVDFILLDGNEKNIFSVTAFPKVTR